MKNVLTIFQSSTATCPLLRRGRCTLGTCPSLRKPHPTAPTGFRCQLGGQETSCSVPRVPPDQVVSVLSHSVMMDMQEEFQGLKEMTSQGPGVLARHSQNYIHGVRLVAPQRTLHFVKILHLNLNSPGSFHNKVFMCFYTSPCP